MRVNWPFFFFGVAVLFAGLTLAGVIHVAVGWAVAILGAVIAIVSLFLGKRDENTIEHDPNVLLQLDRQRPEGDSTSEVVAFMVTSARTALSIKFEPVSTGDYPNGNFVKDDMPVRPHMNSQTMYFPHVEELHPNTPVPVVPQYERDFLNLLRAIDNPVHGLPL